ncbi:MAG: sigma-70 family RNA polymerase sigma factor [Myxococcota bacterium]
MSDDDAPLALAWRDGDDQAGARLIERYYDAIVRLFRTKTDRDVDDLVQRTFLRCAEARDRYKGGSFRAFLFAIARNVLFEKIRARAREARMLEPDPEVASIRDLDPGVSTAAWHRREQRIMVEALQTLPLELQLALELTYWEELSGPELAEVFGVPAGTIKSRLHRARTLLREAMEALVVPSEVEQSVREVVERWVAEVQPVDAPS